MSTYIQEEYEDKTGQDPHDTWDVGFKIGAYQPEYVVYLEWRLAQLEKIVFDKVDIYSTCKTLEEYVEEYK